MLAELGSDEEPSDARITTQTPNVNEGGTAEAPVPYVDHTISQLRDALNARARETETLKELLARSEQEQSKRAAELSKLHAIVLQSQKSSEPFDDTFFRDKFNVLQAQIEHFVKRYFHSTATMSGKPGWKELASIQGAEDKELFLRSEIATLVAQTLFDPLHCSFGLKTQTDELFFRGFEGYLWKGPKVPFPEIVEWRAQTVKIAKTLSHQRGGLDRVPSVCRKLAGQIQDKHKHFQYRAPPPGFDPAVQALCNLAYDLVISLRACKPEYQWQQLRLSTLREQDVEWIEDYNIPSGASARWVPAKMLFGPLYKIVDGEEVLLRKGTVLRS